MNQYLFRFGYCTPEQLKSNKAFGWDEESSMALFVEGETREEAEAWGCQIAELFCKNLFEIANWDGDIPSWKDSDFAFWIEDRPQDVFSDEFLQSLPIIPFGSVPENW